MSNYGNEEVIGKILKIVQQEGGHIKLTNDVIFKDYFIKITDIFADGKLKYQVSGSFKVKNSPVEKKSNLDGINNKILNSILEEIDKNKFI